MPQWLSEILARIRLLAAQGRVLFTHKAARELYGLAVPLEQEDAVELIARLTPRSPPGG